MTIICVIIGGGLGALLRYSSTQLVNKIFNTQFTLGTLFVNCIGAFLIGFLMNIFDTYSFSNKWKLLIITGFLGGYTTFSAYSYETAHYIINGDIKYAIMNIAFNNILCLIFVLLGIWLNKIILVK